MDRQKEEIVCSKQVGANDFCDSKISHQRKKRKILSKGKIEQNALTVLIIFNSIKISYL